MPHHKYARPEVVALPDRSWPDRRIEVAPRWCSVDLRDGNQALVQPMGVDRKRRMFDALVQMGFREIEVGFPSASETEFDFVRELVEQGRVPEEVSIQVLTAAREDLIGPTLESIRGARRATVHLYNSTSPLQRRVVFGMDRGAIREIAVAGARQITELAARMPETEVQLAYSPESFSATELDFAVEVCEAVMEVWGPTPERRMILNLPATVEISSPNVYADQIEAFCRKLKRRDSAVISVHPHNDRGCAVAAAELAVMAGAERVEGTLLGNGERTGNVDLVTLALNLFTQGVDPRLDLSDMDELVRMAEHCTRLPVHPRHPYAGELVYTAFSGSHQDAIRKGLAARAKAGVPAPEDPPSWQDPYDRQNSPNPQDPPKWEVPYLPIDPGDVGRSYEAVIRVNSQSGKAGTAYLLERDRGLRLPRWLQVEFSRAVQQLADRSEEELSSDQLWDLFRRNYLFEGDREGDRLSVVAHRSQPSGQGGEQQLRATVRNRGRERHIEGRGVGPIEAFVDALRVSGIAELQVRDYSEHAIGSGSDAPAAAYVRVRCAGGSEAIGVGVHRSIVTASLVAIACAVNRSRAANSGADAGQEEPRQDLRVDEEALADALREPRAQLG